MNGTMDNLKEKYISLLQSYLVIKGETALRRAYELGREALSAGAGLLDLVEIHQEALSRLPLERHGKMDPRRRGEMTWDFFREALSSFEMIQRGYKDTVLALRERADDLNEANQKLKNLNETLEVKVEERTRTAEEKSRELARSNAELHQFVHVASHDLKEPLRMINSYVQLLQKALERKLEGEEKEYMKFVVEGAHRIQWLIDDLLSYTRLGAQPRSVQRVDLEKIFLGVLVNLKISIQENKAKVTHDPLPVLNADPTHMALLFQNLVANAVKFHGKRKPKVHVSSHREGNHWVFSVADNGIGIDPRYFAKIFEVFQRLHSRDDYPGTGIGLALCQKIVEQDQGKIWVESREGEGSTFRFTIPIKEDSHGR